jgi:serine/threonine protein kinase
VKTCPQCQIKYPDVLEFCPRDGSPLPSAAKDATPDPLIDTTIDGRYAIEARLGEGGMGVVYKARHVLIDKPVAIKILRKEAAQDTASVQRFIQEAKSASKINHSNIVDITDFGVLPDGHAYFVMEFLQGPTLAQAITQGPMESGRVCSIGAQVSRGLHAAHQKGIVHRDLKPENIFLLEREGQKDYVKIVDFGIAKVGGGAKLTQVGMVLGTPEYMSPEQATGQETDHRVDQYALGCIMYEMLTGAVPFLGERPAQTLTKHVFEPVVHPRKRKPDLNIPASLEAVVLRTLEKKPEKRFPSMRELEQALTQVEQEMKGGRVVIEDPKLVTSASGPNATVPAPAVVGGSLAPQPAPVIPPPPGFFQPPQMGGSYPPTPQAVPPGPGLVRPTREGVEVVKTRQLRKILAAVAGALTVVIALLVYFLLSKEEPRPGVPPIKSTPPTKIDTPPIKVDTPPIKTGPDPVVQPPMVSLLVSSKPPGADVVVDNAVRGITPLRFMHKRGSTLALEVRKNGFQSFTQELTPEKDDVIEVKLDKDRSGGRPKKGDKKGGSTKTPGRGDGKGGKTSLPSGLRDPFKR